MGRDQTFEEADVVDAADAAPGPPAPEREAEDESLPWLEPMSDESFALAEVETIGYTNRPADDAEYGEPLCESLAAAHEALEAAHQGEVVLERLAESDSGIHNYLCTGNALFFSLFNGIFQKCKNFF